MKSVYSFIVLFLFFIVFEAASFSTETDKLANEKCLQLTTNKRNGGTPVIIIPKPCSARTVQREEPFPRGTVRGSHSRLDGLYPESQPGWGFQPGTRGPRFPTQHRGVRGRPQPSMTSEPRGGGFYVERILTPVPDQGQRPKPRPGQRRPGDFRGSPNTGTGSGSGFPRRPGFSSSGSLTQPGRPRPSSGFPGQGTPNRPGFPGSRPQIQPGRPRPNSGFPGQGNPSRPRFPDSRPQIQPARPQPGSGFSGQGGSNRPGFTGPQTQPARPRPQGFPKQNFPDRNQPGGRPDTRFPQPGTGFSGIGSSRPRGQPVRPGRPGLGGPGGPFPVDVPLGPHPDRGLGGTRCFTYVPNKVLYGHAQEMLFVPTLAECQKACEAARGYICLSVSYYRLEERCLLNRQNAQQQPKWFVPSEIDGEYHENNCARPEPVDPRFGVRPGFLRENPQTSRVRSNRHFTGLNGNQVGHDPESAEDLLHMFGPSGSHRTHHEASGQQRGQPSGSADHDSSDHLLHLFGPSGPHSTHQEGNGDDHQRWPPPRQGSLGSSDRNLESADNLLHHFGPSVPNLHEASQGLSATSASAQPGLYSGLNRFGSNRGTYMDSPKRREKRQSSPVVENFVGEMITDDVMEGSCREICQKLQLPESTSPLSCSGSVKVTQSVFSSLPMPVPPENLTYGCEEEACGETTYCCCS